MGRRRVVALFALVFLSTVSRSASAFREMDQVGDDVRVHLDEAGVASVEDVLRWRVVRGPLKAVDLANLPLAAELDPRVVVTGEDGRELSAHSTRTGGDTARVTMDDPRAGMRGTFSLSVHYRIDLASSHALVWQGATWRLTWSTLASSSPQDSVRVTFDSPSAPEAPEVVVADTGAVDVSAVSALRREADRDVLELVKPHLARAESATWTVRFDSRSLPRVATPKPVLRANPGENRDRIPEVLLATLLSSIALGFGLLLWKKTRVFGSLCRERKVASSGLVPMGHGLRSAAYGVLLAAGVGLELFDLPTPGGALIAGATLLAALRPGKPKLAARGPGRWLPMRPSDAFASPARAGDAFDIASRAGQRSAAALSLLLALVASVGMRFAGRPALAVAVGVAAALAPIFITGVASQVASSGRGESGALVWLARAHRKLRRAPFLRVSPLARVAPNGTAEEVRLLLQPRVAMPGLVGIELGLAWTASWGGYAPCPELLIRVLEGTAAASKLASFAPKARSVAGRRPGERVVRLVPRAPAIRSASKLAEELARLLTDQRLGPGIIDSPERRAIAPRQGAVPDPLRVRSRVEPQPVRRTC